MSAARGDCSAAERNKAPILTALGPYLPCHAEVLEIGAGNGAHARYATAHRPDLRWQTSEAPANQRGLAAALIDAGGDMLPTPLALDVRHAWPNARYDIVYGANIAHIMTCEAMRCLFASAGCVLKPDGRLCLYGPFLDRDEETGPGNLVFDRALRAGEDGRGMRERGWLDELAARAALMPEARHVMPSDNRLLIWQRASL